MVLRLFVVNGETGDMVVEEKKPQGGRNTPDFTDVNTLAGQLGAQLSACDLKITTAESCTGGLIASAITEVAGSSGWFERSVVTYSNTAKQELLGVDASIFIDHGAVSEACVKAMAEGALAASGADVAISVSGIAGPDGSTPDKPVGTVWIGWALARAGHVDAESFHFKGDRAAVRQQAVSEALRGTISRLSSASNV